MFRRTNFKLFLKIIPHFLLKIIGGFSIVHKGFYKGTSVAVKKIFNPNITSEMMDEFNNEIDMLNRLRHPNIVLLMGVCSKPQNISIVTELLPGGSLYTLLHSSK